MDGRNLHSFDAWGVNVIGFHRSDFGIAEAGRRVIQALDARRIPLLPLHDLRLGRWQTGDPPFPSIEIEQAAFPVNLLCMNGDHVLGLFDSTDPVLFEGRYSAALWFWESEAWPEAWLPTLEHVDEVWVPSGFVAESMSKGLPVPVTQVRIPVTATSVHPVEWRSYGVPDEAFVFLYVFDYGSSGARKNPLGAIEAFQAAFPPGSGVALVLKSSMSDYGGDLAVDVREAAASHPDIHIIDRRLPATEKDALVAGCDCYLSLHRSEGFGLSPAEAMCRAKPVIATGYGGTLDFMTDENSYLVDYSLVAVGEGHAPYSPTSRWAEPDIEHAARLMRHVFENRDEAARIGRQAAADMRRRHSPDAAGVVMEERLTAIRSMFPSGSESDSPPRSGWLRSRLARVFVPDHTRGHEQPTAERLATELRWKREQPPAATAAGSN